MPLVVINSAVDSVYFSYKGEVKDGLFNVLETLQKDAKSLEHPVEIELGDERLLLHNRGAGMYAYWLQGDGFVFKMSPKEKIPRLYVEPQAHLLYELGHEKAFQRIQAMVDQIGELKSASISRLDLCVDFQGFELTKNREDDFVCRSRFSDVRSEGKKAYCFYFGKGNIIVRIYNKTKEIKASGKDWMIPVWQQNQLYQEDKDVWRFEVQLRRKPLKELQCDTIEDTFTRLFGIFQYIITDWLTLREPTTGRIERSPVDQNWLALSEATFPGISCDRVPAKKREADIRRLVRGARGYLTSYGAIRGKKDYHNVKKLFERDMRQDDKRKGTTFEEEVLMKMELLAGYRKDEPVL